MKKTKLKIITQSFMFTALLAITPLAHAQTPLADQAIEGTSIRDFADTLTGEDRDAFEKDLTKEGISLQDAANVRMTTEETSKGKTLVLLLDESSPLPPSHVLYLGIRIGMMFPVGVEAVYQYKVNGLTRFHADAGVTTSYYIHSIEAAGAWHPRNGRAFFMGVRTKDTILFDSSSGYKGIFNPYEAGHFFSIGPEIGWQKAMGKRKMILGTIALGVQKAFGQDYNLPLMPDIRFGLAIRIFKK